MTSSGAGGLVGTLLKSVIPGAAAILAFAALASCGENGGSTSGNGATSGNAAQATPPVSLFPDDFKGVCSGASVSAAKAYDPAASGHKALYFSTYKEGFIDYSSSLPKDWTIQWSATGDALKDVDLILCARRTATRLLKVCDGYENDGKPTSNKVRWHAATYELSVMEARTGKKLAEKSVEASSSLCPMFMNFDGSSDTVDDYASLSDTVLADFLRPHVVH